MQVLEGLEKSEHPFDLNLQNWPTTKNLSLDHLFCISDFMLPLQKIESWLEEFLGMAPVIHCLQVLDPLESGEGSKPSMVHDLEEPKLKRKLSTGEWEQYLKNMADHQQQLAESCRIRNIRLRSIKTDQPVATAISSLLKESKRGKGLDKKTAA